MHTQLAYASTDQTASPSQQQHASTTAARYQHHPCCMHFYKTATHPANTPAVEARRRCFKAGHSTPSCSACQQGGVACVFVYGLCHMLSPAGRGAYGSVYKARDKATGQLVAIKVISTTDSDADDLERIHKEVCVAQHVLYHSMCCTTAMPCAEPQGLQSAVSDSSSCWKMLCWLLQPHKSRPTQKVLPDSASGPWTRAVVSTACALCAGVDGRPHPAVYQCRWLTPAPSPCSVALLPTHPFAITPFVIGPMRYGI